MSPRCSQIDLQKYLCPLSLPTHTFCHVITTNFSVAYRIWHNGPTQSSILKGKQNYTWTFYLFHFVLLMKNRKEQCSFVFSTLDLISRTAFHHSYYKPFGIFQYQIFRFRDWNVQWLKLSMYKATDSQLDLGRRHANTWARSFLLSLFMVADLLESEPCPGFKSTTEC